MDTPGCRLCWPSDPEAAWEARQGLACQAEMIDESHLHVMILACPACSQRFLSVFCERIDWVDGDDPQCWTVMPLTHEEAAGLSGKAGTLTEPEINGIGRNRRSLQHDCPKGADPTTSWSVGIFVGPHD